MRVTIDPNKCVGSGNCILTAPAVFGQDDDGIVTLLNAAPPESEQAAVRTSAEICPARVITLD
ncbi:MAG: ferredoxin [Brevundimonas sp.]